MTIIIGVVVSLVLLLLVVMLTRRRVALHRSVLLHTPAPLVWRRIEDFPQLLEGHGRGRSLGAFTQHTFVKGDPHSNGSVWRARGTWAGSDYWVDAELLRVEAGREIVIRLRRDSLHTHHGLHGHVAKLKLQPNGPGTSKLTWDLQARFRPWHLLWQRHCDRDGLKARLLDISLRSIKVDIDSGNGDPDAGDTPRHADRGVPESSRSVITTPPAAGSEGPPMQIR